MKTEITIKQRLLLAERFPLPTDSDLVTLRIVRDLRAKIEFTQEELDEIKLTPKVDKGPDGKVKTVSYAWDEKVREGYDLELTDREVKLMAMVANVNQRLPLELLDFLESIVKEAEKIDKKDKKKKGK